MLDIITESKFLLYLVSDRIDLEMRDNRLLCLRYWSTSVDIRCVLKVSKGFWVNIEKSINISKVKILISKNFDISPGLRDFKKKV